MNDEPYRESGGRGSRQEVHRSSFILHRAGVVLLLLIAILLAVPLVREGFWRDEACSIGIARDHDMWTFFHDIRTADPHPPLFNALLAVVGRMCGWSELGIKLFALFWGLAAIAGIIAAAWQLLGPGGGLLAGAIALHSPLVTAHLGEARNYAMSVALLTFGIAALCRGWRAAAVVLLSLACWSHYIAFVAIAGCFGVAAVLAAVRRSAEWRTIAKVNLLAAATMLPLVPLIIAHATTGLPHEARPTLATALANAARKIGYSFPSSDFAVAPARAIAVAIIAAVALLSLHALGGAFRARARPFAIVAAYALPVFVLFAPLGAPERYVLIGAALLCVAIAAVIVAIDAAAGSRPRMALRIAVIAYFALSLGTVAWHAPQIAGTTLTKSGARTLCAEGRFTPNDLIVVAPDVLAPTMGYYARGHPMLHGFVQWDRPEMPDQPLQKILWPRHIAPLTAQRLDDLMRTRRPARVFFVTTELQPGGALSQREQIAALAGEIAKKHPFVPVGVFPGRVETLLVWRLR